MKSAQPNVHTFLQCECIHENRCVTFVYPHSHCVLIHASDPATNVPGTDRICLQWSVYNLLRQNDSNGLQTLTANRYVVVCRGRLYVHNYTTFEYVGPAWAHNDLSGRTHAFTVDARIIQSVCVWCVCVRFCMRPTWFLRISTHRMNNDHRDHKLSMNTHAPASTSNCTAVYELGNGSDSVLHANWLQPKRVMDYLY